MGTVTVNGTTTVNLYRRDLDNNILVSTLPSGGQLAFDASTKSLVLKTDNVLYSIDYTGMVSDDVIIHGNF